MGTTAEKLNYLKETKTEIKNALETPSSIFRDYSSLIKKYIDNQPTKTVNDGVCGSAVDLPIKAINIDGNSEQETTEGYNILQNIVHKNDENYTTNGITFIKNSDGSIVANGTATANAKYYFVSESGTRENIKAGVYRITGCPSGGSASSYRIVIGITGIGEKYEDGNGVNITISSDNTYYFAILIYGGQTVSNLVFKPMIVSGTEDKPYEPYTGGISSPNPDYPQEIEVINSIGLEQSGKNKLDFTNYAEKVFDSSKVEKLSDGSYKIKHADASYPIYEGLLKAPYTLSFLAKNDTGETSSPTFMFKVFYEDGTDKKLSFNTNGTFEKKTFVIDKNVVKIANSYIKSSSPYTIIKDVQLEEGSTATPYEPYHETKVIPIDLQGNTLAKVGDIKDKLRIYRNGDVEIEKNVGKIVLTGSEKLIDNSLTSTRKWWGIDFSNYGIYQYNDTTKVCDVLTTKFKSRPQQGTFLPGQVALITSNKNMYFVFEPDMTEEQARAILKDMPVYFRLAEPQTIKLPSISPIELWQGTNIFKLITNLDTTFEVEYVVNKDSVLNEVQTAMLEAEIEI